VPQELPANNEWSRKSLSLQVDRDPAGKIGDPGLIVPASANEVRAAVHYFAGSSCGTAGRVGSDCPARLSNDVYAQIGLVMLIGCSSKNAILIVEFAEQLQDEGLSTIEAAMRRRASGCGPILILRWRLFLAWCR